MATSLLERLPRLVANGRRQAQRLIESTTGRNRERAVTVERVQAPNDPPHAGTPAPRRLLCGTPALCIAALIAEVRAGHAAPPGRIVIDLHPAPDEDAHTLATRVARWAPCIALLRKLAPEAAFAARFAESERGAMHLVLDAFGWPADGSDCAPCDTMTLLLAEDPKRIADLAPPDAAWIACMRDVAASVALRRMLLLRADTSFAIDEVGATPSEWTRRHAAAQPVRAMQAALAAFGAKPLASPAVSTTPAGRRRAGGDVLLGEIVRNGVRTLVWVDAPDRRTGESTLSRAVTRREVGHYPHVIVLGWHFAPAVLQQRIARSDSRVEVRRIQLLPRGERGPALRIDPRGFVPLGGLAQGWADREPSRSAPDSEWLAVQLAQDETIDDWAIDPAHDGEVFRGTWHALRDGAPGVRTVRLRLPKQTLPRRVCVRAIDAQGRASELRFYIDTEKPAPPLRNSAVPMRARGCAQAEALC